MPKRSSLTNVLSDLNFKSITKLVAKIRQIEENGCESV